jgi:hypothetical protein
LEDLDHYPGTDAPTATPSPAMSRRRTVGRLAYPGEPDDTFAGELDAQL